MKQRKLAFFFIDRQNLIQKYISKTFAQDKIKRF